MYQSTQHIRRVSIQEMSAHISLSLVRLDASLCALFVFGAKGAEQIRTTKSGSLEEAFSFIRGFSPRGISFFVSAVFEVALVMLDSASGSVKQASANRVVLGGSS